MTAHSQFRYSITCHTDDLAVVYCLRAIADLSEKHPQCKISWGNTDNDVWKRDGNHITLRFTQPEYRQDFRDVANDLLNGRWSETDHKNDNPATPKLR